MEETKFFLAGGTFAPLHVLPLLRCGGSFLGTVTPSTTGTLGRGIVVVVVGILSRSRSQQYRRRNPTSIVERTTTALWPSQQSRRAARVGVGEGNLTRKIIQQQQQQQVGLLAAHRRSVAIAITFSVG